MYQKNATFTMPLFSQNLSSEPGDRLPSWEHENLKRKATTYRVEIWKEN